MLQCMCAEQVGEPVKQMFDFGNEKFSMYHKLHMLVEKTHANCFWAQNSCGVGMVCAMVLQKDEVVEIVNETNQVLQPATREVMRAKNLLHRCSFVFVFNSKGDLFVQVRVDWHVLTAHMQNALSAWFAKST